MLEREEKTALVLLAVVLLALGAGYSIISYLGSAAFAVPFSVESPEGQLVFLNATIERVTATTNGGNLILDCNGVSVFLPAEIAGKVAIVKGDRVELYGVVQIYRGKKEIVVGSPGDITVNP
ncbi:MAG: hypothetical protein ABFC24_02210 [Methanoregulaceae archaeon]